MNGDAVPEEEWEEWRPLGKLDFGLQTSRRNGDPLGRLRISAGVLHLMGDPKRVTLLYKPGQRVVGVRAADPGDPFSYRLTVNGGSARDSKQVTCREFTQHYGIAFATAVKFPAHDYGGGVWGFALAEGVEARRGGWQGRRT